MYREIKNIVLAALISVPLSALAAPSSPAPVTPAEAKSAEAQSFPTPDDAAKALLEAARSDDRNQIIAIFGSHDAELLSSGDEVEDKNNRSEFVTLAQEKMAVEKTSEDQAIVHAGNKDWPFPIPLVKKNNGWQFDAEQGRQEILNRRIGRNELSTLDVLRGYWKPNSIMPMWTGTETVYTSMRKNCRASPASLTACFGSRKRGNRKALWGRWLPMQERKVIRSKAQRKADTLPWLLLSHSDPAGQQRTRWQI